MSDKPIDQVNVGSGITADIWKNTSGEGKEYFTVSVSRSYMGDDKEWHQTNTFSRDHLPKLAIAANKAFEKIVDLQYSRSHDKEEETTTFAEREQARRGRNEAEK